MSIILNPDIQSISGIQQNLPISDDIKWCEPKICFLEWHSKMNRDEIKDKKETIQKNALSREKQDQKKSSQDQPPITKHLFSLNHSEQPDRHHTDSLDPDELKTYKINTNPTIRQNGLTAYFSEDGGQFFRTVWYPSTAELLNNRQTTLIDINDEDDDSKLYIEGLDGKCHEITSMILLIMVPLIKKCIAYDPETLDLFHKKKDGDLVVISLLEHLLGFRLLIETQQKLKKPD